MDLPDWARWARILGDLTLDTRSPSLGAALGDSKRRMPVRNMISNPSPEHKAWILGTEDVREWWMKDWKQIMINH